MISYFDNTKGQVIIAPRGGMACPARPLVGCMIDRWRVHLWLRRGGRRERDDEEWDDEEEWDGEEWDGEEWDEEECVDEWDGK